MSGLEDAARRILDIAAPALGILVSVSLFVCSIWLAVHELRHQARRHRAAVAARRRRQIRVVQAPERSDRPRDLARAAGRPRAREISRVSGRR